MSESHQRLDERKKLWIMKVAVILIILSLCVVGRRRTAWPFVNMTMYSSKNIYINDPPQRVFAYRFRIIDHADQVYRLKPCDIIPFDRCSRVEKSVISRAIEEKNPQLRERYRVYLSRLVSHALPKTTPKTIQVFQMTWPVDPLHVPPFDIKNPSEDVLLASLTVQQE